ncbi:uncharacterized protein Dana_GF24438, isoform B [Drosophila ananassae]|uniref:Uncharacterized protein, isoform B n=2 Tax=Drosophila ananassae TaxID=7217 RepID=A0A0P9BRX7_DROAN|nr:zinc finger and SCAN domain-containing protein 10 isoform X1 [Drosophila ananassae]KPU74475.1 uncharacterized protein Dana_GF24438, isoform B [Drosophila ananassae]
MLSKIKIMELALNKSSSCADCCSDCTLMPCCSASACCDANCGASCGLIPPDPVRYEYQEPEENFVSIDDAKIKGLLWRIGQQQQQQKELELKRIQEEERKKREMELKRREEERRRVEEVIDLDPEDTHHPKGLIISAARSLASWNCSINRISPDIELVPRQEQRIVAEIELSDSEQEEDQKSDKDLGRNLLPPDQDESDPKNSQNQDQIITLQSEEEDQEPKKILRRRNTSSRWSAKKRRPYVNRRGRPMYECPACGKKVQSNYNLRRHMMIHTGERPFPCDLCERRFREFSDLKKHRRRHSHDPQYICMICHVGQPLVQDSTRCADCESKNLMIKPQPEDLGNKTGEEQELEDDDEEEDDMEEEDTEEMEEQLPQPVLPPTLMVTLIPATKSLPETGSSSRLPNRPPLPPSCSSANSSSSLSNDGNVSTKPRNRSRRSYPCPLCHRPFGTRHNLKRHYMIHTGEKPFSCSKCRKPFRECSTLKKHMVTHMRDRWYKCLRCPSKFRDYLEYSDHKENHLEQLRIRKSSTYESDEDEDSSVEDWLECCECQQRFTELDAYTEHLKKHDLELYGMSVDDVDEEREDVDVA